MEITMNKPPDAPRRAFVVQYRDLAAWTCATGRDPARRDEWWRECEVGDIILGRAAAPRITGQQALFVYGADALPSHWRQDKCVERTFRELCSPSGAGDVVFYMGSRGGVNTVVERLGKFGVLDSVIIFEPDSFESAVGPAMNPHMFTAAGRRYDETDPNDHAILQALSEASFGPDAQVTLPSGRVLNGQQVREAARRLPERPIRKNDTTRTIADPVQEVLAEELAGHAENWSDLATKITAILRGKFEITERRR